MPRSSAARSLLPAAAFEDVHDVAVHDVFETCGGEGAEASRLKGGKVEEAR